MLLSSPKTGKARMVETGTPVMRAYNSTPAVREHLLPLTEAAKAHRNRDAYEQRKLAEDWLHSNLESFRRTVGTPGARGTRTNTPNTPNTRAPKKGLFIGLEPQFPKHSTSF